MRKNSPLLVLEFSGQVPYCPDFGPKKQFPVQVLKRLQLTCASELKPHIQNDEDPWEKIHQFRYWNFLDRYPIVIFAMWLLSREFQYLKLWFFSHGSSLLCIWGLSSEAQVIWSLLSTCTGNCFFRQKSGQFGKTNFQVFLWTWCISIPYSLYINCHRS